MNNSYVIIMDCSSSPFGFKLHHIELQRVSISIDPFMLSLQLHLKSLRFYHRTSNPNNMLSIIRIK